jgi:hypothetical protein
MNHEDHVRAALKALADHDRERESQLPPPKMPLSRPSLHAVSKWKTGSAYALTALAAAASVMVLMQPPTDPTVEAPPAGVIEPAPVPVTEAPPDPAPAKPKAVRRAQPKPVLASVPEPPQEIVTEFFPLNEPGLPFEHGQLLRVMVPATTMRRVGIPVSPDRWGDRVQADLLVGDDSLPRAIRFVSYQQ